MSETNQYGLAVQVPTPPDIRPKKPYELHRVYPSEDNAHPIFD
jgi:hypothetical protein